MIKVVIEILYIHMSLFLNKLLFPMAFPSPTCQFQTAAQELLFVPETPLLSKLLLFPIAPSLPITSPLLGL